MAYKSPDGLYLHKPSNVLFVAGTKSLSDAATDLLIPFHALPLTSRYQNMERIIRTEGVRMAVGHSLGGALLTQAVQKHSSLRARVYGAPTLFKHSRIEALRHPYDPISLSNRVGGAKNVRSKFRNPHSFRGFQTRWNRP